MSHQYINQYQQQARKTGQVCSSDKSGFFSWSLTPYTSKCSSNNLNKAITWHQTKTCGKSYLLILWSQSSHDLLTMQARKPSTSHHYNFFHHFNYIYILYSYIYIHSQLIAQTLNSSLFSPKGWELLGRGGVRTLLNTNYVLPSI